MPEVSIRAGQVWIGTSAAVRDRKIRITAIDGDLVSYEVTRQSMAIDCPYCPSAGLAERSLRRAYRLATAAEQDEADAAEVPSPMTLTAVQDAIVAHRQARGLGTTDLSMEIRLLVEGVGELSTAVRRMAPHQDVGGDVADVITLALSIAAMLGFDAGEIVATRMRASKARTYRKLPVSARA
jgi:NTP pyrophosphatase (non-canonical NTP hydrolase)